jgi:L-arabinose isomerase
MARRRCGRSIGGRQEPVRLVFTARPGPAVVVGLMDLGTRLRLVANEIDVVDPDQDLPRLPVARAAWRPRPDLATSAESWLLAGGPHHIAFSSAGGIEALEDFAEIAGVELVAIGAETTASGFRKKLRWNQAYHHMAGGI